MQIMRSILILSLVFSAAAVSAQAPQDAAPTPYSQMVDRLKAGDRTVNFTEFRMAFTETPAYNGLMMGVYRQLWNPLNARDFEGALKIVEAVLQRNYTEPNAHMVATIAHGQLGHQAESQFHRFIADGLLQSITSQGDGKTPETAYVVIDVSEEYALFRSMNLSATGQGASGGSNGEPFHDSMTLVDNRTKEQRMMYFTVETRDSLAKKRQAPR